ncbi:MAG: PAAR domain-containing protein [Deltaproteobacteria bacterium]|nr:PAAR domain-containing protein [Deltaproteobacteria bacterium]
MPEQGRVSDIGKISADAHGCPACPHGCNGPLVGGSPDVFVNTFPAMRLGDPGIHAACCGPNIWQTSAGSGTVFINKKKAVRKGDKTTHCGGTGAVDTGSGDVFTGG